MRMGERMKTDAPGTDASALFDDVVQDMHDLYDNQITEGEAQEAASNLIGFCKTLLEIKMEQVNNKNHAEMG